MSQKVISLTARQQAGQPMTPVEAIDLYGIRDWGLGYFSVNETGALTCRPEADPQDEISLVDVVERAQRLGLNFPLQVRFQNLLHHRVEAIQSAFAQAIQKTAYQNSYRGVFPAKVNQLKEVIEEILIAGQPYGSGLEVGSKAELVAALALNESSASLIICNGYKDDEYIRLALLGQQVGHHVKIVIEKVDEVERIIRLAEALQIKPVLGIRVRLASKASGPWANSSGDLAKFGLSVSEVLHAWQRLSEADLGTCLNMIHFHIGSQISDIQFFQRAAREAARYYAQLIKLGAPLECLDVGGGLAVDYDGCASTHASSMNYSLDEYAMTIVQNIQQVCNQEQVNHPMIISESGRATVAHHSVLVVEAFANVEKVRSFTLPQLQQLDDEPQVVHDTFSLRQQWLDGAEGIVVYHALLEIREASQQLFELGQLSLTSKAHIEDCFWHTVAEIAAKYHQDEDRPAEIKQLIEQLSAQYVCNFSIFQSLLDNWAIDQLFPIIPIHRLNEQPNHEATLVDITCDSEGKIESFISDRGGVGALPLHEIGEAPYYLGVFLTGAYQDIMGDHHNLFGRVNEVHVYKDASSPGGFYIEEVMHGSTIDEVLKDTQYDIKDLVRRFKFRVDQAVQEGQLGANQAYDVMSRYRKALAGYTYLTDS